MCRCVCRRCQRLLQLPHPCFRDHHHSIISYIHDFHTVKQRRYIGCSRRRFRRAQETPLLHETAEAVWKQQTATTTTQNNISTVFSTAAASHGIWLPLHVSGEAGNMLCILDPWMPCMMLLFTSNGGIANDSNGNIRVASALRKTPGVVACGNALWQRTEFTSHENDTTAHLIELSFTALTTIKYRTCDTSP
jgi:hypothetical protein